VTKVVLYGNSLAVSGVGASLEGRPGLQVVRVDAAERSAEALRELEPDVVVFDLATARPDVVELWRRDRPVLPIGVDLVKHQVVVFSGESSRALTTDDLLRVIESRTGPQTRRKRP
jgi:DNA-binding NarL/FixJ family response regulator